MCSHEFGQGLCLISCQFRNHSLFCSFMKERIIKALERRKKGTKDDDFRIKYGYSWDMMMVFRVYGAAEHLNEQQLKYR